MGNTISIKKKHIFNKSKEGNYVIKVDDLQIDRIQQQHHIFKGFCNTNFTSPISKDLTRGIKVLDVGSGPGTWIFDMSSEFPNSNFTGVEIQSFMLPTIHPSNTRFVYSDVLKGLPFDSNSFDYIHMRFMILCFTEPQYQQVVKHLVNLLKPNGFIELCETELQFYNMGPIAKKFNDALFKLMITRSMNPYLNHQLHEFLKDTGLQQIQQKDIMIPLSALDGKLGSMMGENVINVVTGLRGSLTKIMNKSDSEMDELIGQLITEIKSIKMYMRYTRIYGRKLSISSMNRKFRTY